MVLNRLQLSSGKAFEKAVKRRHLLDNEDPDGIWYEVNKKVYKSAFKEKYPEMVQVVEQFWECETQVRSGGGDVGEGREGGEGGEGGGGGGCTTFFRPEKKLFERVLPPVIRPDIVLVGGWKRFDAREPPGYCRSSACSLVVQWRNLGCTLVGRSSLCYEDSANHSPRHGAYAASYRLYKSRTSPRTSP